jgi:hypothetical protein
VISPSQRPLPNLQTTNTRDDTSRPSAGFEPAISAIKRSQAYALVPRGHWDRLREQILLQICDLQVHLLSSWHKTHVLERRKAEVDIWLHNHNLANFRLSACQYIVLEPFTFRRPLQWVKAAIARVDKVFSCALSAVASGTLQLTQGIVVKFNYSE